MESSSSAGQKKKGFIFQEFITSYGVYLALVMLLIVAALITPNLFEKETLAVMFRQCAQLGIIAIGQNYGDACCRIRPVSGRSHCNDFHSCCGS